jgi:hypothetical protein
VEQYKTPFYQSGAVRQIQRESQITNRQLQPTSTMNNARNWILLGCEIGQRGGANIEPENIRYNGKSIYIDIIQQKNKKNVGIFSPYVSDLFYIHF